MKFKLRDKVIILIGDAGFEPGTMGKIIRFSKDIVVVELPFETDGFFFKEELVRPSKFFRRLYGVDK